MSICTSGSLICASSTLVSVPCKQQTPGVSLLKPRLEPSGSDDQQSASQYFQSHRGLCTVLGWWEEARKANSSVAYLEEGFFIFQSSVPHYLPSSFKDSFHVQMTWSFQEPSVKTLLREGDQRGIGVTR